MKSDRHWPVAIIGGGFSGTMVAGQLARRRVESVLIEGGGRAGLGIAYSTREPAHVLNVRADAMSAWAHDPDHFARTFEQQGGHARGFAERRLFGRYVQSILDEASRSGAVSLVERPAVSAQPNETGWVVELDDGQVIRTDALVLALGNQPPEPLPFAAKANARLINNPWDGQAQSAIAELASTGADALIIGTGLTMIDTVLSLDAAGHKGRILALSRRGLIPRAHAEFRAAPVELSGLPSGSVLQLWRWLRRRSSEVGWRAAVDALRPHSHPIWQTMRPAEQRRFLRHARAWWDVHRHRIAPEVAERIRELVGEGRLTVVAGRILEMREDDGEVLVRYRRRNSCEAEARFERAFNCTGPLGTITRTRDPMLRKMLDQKLVQADSIGMGLEVDSRSRLQGAERAWAMGPLTKGRFWEIVAVPDIRGQAAQVAEDVAMALGR